MRVTHTRMRRPREASASLSANGALDALGKAPDKGASRPDHIVGVEIDDGHRVRVDLGQGRRVHRGVHGRDRAPDAEAAEDGLVCLLAADGTDIEATAHGGELITGEVVGHLKVFDLHGRCS
jgi:hypothetical protein